MTTQSSPPGLELNAIERYLSHVLPDGLAGPLTATLIAGGRSNLTYEVTDGSQRWILRRPPLGHVLATAHDMAREYRVISALAPTPVPVPRSVAYCAEPTVIGAPFYVMEKVEGSIYRTDEDVAVLDAAPARALSEAMVDVLGDLHLVSYAESGLADFGRPEGYLKRQLRRWQRQLEESRTREVPGFEQLAAKLGSMVPASQRASIVHGDYRLDNLVVAEDQPGEIRAVLDWEMATLGDPLADLGLLLVYWNWPADVENPIAARLNGPGFLTGEEVIARYADRTRFPLDGLDWYVAFASYKLAVIFEGIHCRFVQGLTVGEGFDLIGPLVPPFVERALADLERQSAKS